MRLLNELRQQGFEVMLVGDRIGVKPADKLTPELIEQIRKHKPKLIEELRKQTKPDEYKSIGRGQSVDSRGSGKAKRYCTSYQPPRYVHPDVCSWHVQQADLACAECKHLTKAEREFFMDNYLNKAIAELNARGCRYYTPGDPQGQRQRIYDLEKRITEAFLIGDVGGFMDTVNRWVKCFKGGVDHG